MARVQIKYLAERPSDPASAEECTRNLWLFLPQFCSFCKRPGTDQQGQTNSILIFSHTLIRCLHSMKVTRQKIHREDYKFEIIF